MSDERKTKCSVLRCREAVVEGTQRYKTDWGVVRITPPKGLFKKPLCRKHLIELLNGEDLPGLGRMPGSGVRFLKKALCSVKKESVNSEECFACYSEGGHPKHIKHLICQDTNLTPSPLDRFAGDYVPEDKDD